MTSLVVHLNRGELYGVEPATATVEVEGSFALELRNHGQAVHVHLRLDDDLARVAGLNGTNLFVDTESVVTVPVEVADGAPPVRGTLTLVSGYGKGEADVGVHLVDEADGRVAVDEDLGRPGTGEAGPASAGDADDDPGSPDPGAGLPGTLAVDRVPLAGLVDGTASLLVGALILCALGVSAVALLAAPGLAVVLGILAVLGGVATAAYVMMK